MADFGPNFVAMATGIRRSKICLALLNSTTAKTPCYTKKSRGYLLYKPSYSRFCPKFRSLARPRNPPVVLKDLVDISYIGRVIADFVPNSAAMATGVGRSKICLATFTSPTPITPCYAQ